MTPADDDVMRPDDIETLAALYAAGALTPDEAAAVDARIERGDPELRDALRALDLTVEALVENVPPQTPDPRIKASLLARIGVGSDDAAPLSESRAAAAIWDPVIVNGTTWTGVTARVLHIDETRGRVTTLLRMTPEGVIPAHTHEQDEECFVVEGDLRFGDRVYAAGDFFQAPAGSRHERQWTRTGCTCLVTTSLANEYL